MWRIFFLSSLSQLLLFCFRNAFAFRLFYMEQRYVLAYLYPAVFIFFFCLQFNVLGIDSIISNSNSFFYYPLPIYCGLCKDPRCYSATQIEIGQSISTSLRVDWFWSVAIGTTPMEFYQGLLFLESAGNINRGTRLEWIPLLKVHQWILIRMEIRPSPVAVSDPIG